MTFPPIPPGFSPALRAPGARWPALAVTAGLLGLATAFLPFGAGLLAVVFAGAGIAAGVAARSRVVPGPGRRLATAGVVASSLAVVLAMVMAVVYQPARQQSPPADDSSWLHRTDDVEEILRDQLQVGFGAVVPGGKTLLPVTLTNRLDRGATFHLVIAGFVGDTEVARDTGYAILAGHATQRIGVFYRYRIGESGIPRLRKARFRVVEASTYW